MDKKLDHWTKKTLDFVVPYFSDARRNIRIATGFFTIQGYDLIRPYVSNKSVFILVGYDETQNLNLLAKLIDDIIAYLRRSDSQNRRQAVEDLVGKLERKEFFIAEKENFDFVDGRIRKDDHGKVYILDEDVVLTGSLNLTVTGLRSNEESQTSISDPERVKWWLELFEAKWNAPDTHDLTQALLEALQNWLKLHIPYDVYLKTLLALVKSDDIPGPRSSYKIPAEYQEVIVKRVLRQLREYRGAMLVASTGLGKTIIATDICFRLLLEKQVGNIVVFAPTAVQPDWSEALDSAMLNYKIFTRSLLDKDTRGPEGKRLATTLERLDEKYLIILDESQYFRNEIRQQGGQRLSFQRLIDLVNSKNCFVLLLTATPLAKSDEDLNSQLSLLPHTAPPSYVRSDGQMGMEGMVDFHPKAWRVMEGDDSFDQFMHLPVSTVVSTSWVAKNFGVKTEDGDYVQRPDEVGWLPRIEISKIKVPVLCEDEMGNALNRGFFTHKALQFQSRGKWRISKSNIENEANISWASSPLALQEVVQKTIDDSYKVEFVKSNDERKKVLTPILNKLSRFSYEDDTKFTALVNLLHQFQKEGQKVIIFTEREATAVYLEKALKQKMSQLRVASVAKEAGPFKYELKNFENEVYDMILDFAPEANKGKIYEPRKRTFDVFIFTDAYSMGVNLQDASVVINYDLSWTADTLIQRAGRILRFWIRPRQVHIYIFIGDYKYNRGGQEVSHRIEQRLEQLTRRTKQAEKFSELPIIPDSDHTTYSSLGDLSNVVIEDLGEIDITQVEEFSGGSPFLKHITELKQNSSYAKAIPDDISSAMLYNGNRRQLYLLVQHEKAFYWRLYDVQSRKLNPIKEDDLLNLLECTRLTPNADIDINEIEEQAQLCKALLCRELDFDPTETERICALYLKPKAEANDMDKVMGNQ